MTVKELIELLKKAPEEAEVLVSMNGSYNSCNFVDVYESQPDKDNAKVYICDHED